MQTAIINRTGLKILVIREYLNEDGTPTGLLNVCKCDPRRWSGRR